MIIIIYHLNNKIKLQFLWYIQKILNVMSYLFLIQKYNLQINETRGFAYRYASGLFQRYKNITKTIAYID